MDDSLHDPVVGDSLCGLPTFGQAEAPRVHRRKRGTCRITLLTFCSDSWRGRARCDDSRNARELKGISAEKTPGMQVVITCPTEAARGLVDGTGYFVYLAVHEHSYKAAEITKKSTLPPM